MQRHWLWCGVWIAVVCGFAESAQARGRIPIVYGSGEELTDVGELPPPVASEVAAELGHSVKVAFLYSRAHLWWLDVWTWNGHHVLRSGDRYWDLPPEAWQRMLGEPPAKMYGTPLRYRFPILPVGLGLLLAGWGVTARFFKSDEDKLAALSHDKRYQQALATLFATDDPSEPKRGVTRIDEQRFARARTDLIGQGVDPEAAETNLRKLAEVLVARVNAEANASLAVARKLDQCGNLHKSVEAYTALAAWLPLDDERQTEVCSRLTELRKQLDASLKDPIPGE